MPSDGDDEKRGTRARQAPLEGTSYTDAELNARVREFPSLSEIWNENRSDAVLLNPEQCVDVLPIDARGEKTVSEIAYGFIKLNGEVLCPVTEMLRSHYLLRRYKTHITEKMLKLTVDGNRTRDRRRRWHPSDHNKRRAVESLQALYGVGAIQFRHDVCQLYHLNFGVWLSRRSALRRPQSIPVNEELEQQLSIEDSIIDVLRRALSDAERASSEWSPILSGKHVPSLNKLHRIVNPNQDSVDRKKGIIGKMDDDQIFITSIVMCLFGCTNAALVYPKLVAFEDVFQVLCFLGRVNYGEIWPTVREAQAFLKYCDVGCDETVPAAVKNIITAADDLCGWVRFRTDLAETCRKTIEAADAGHPLPRRFGRLWPMV